MAFKHVLVLIQVSVTSLHRKDDTQINLVLAK